MIAIATREPARCLPEEFDRIYREHAQFIYRTAFRITADRQDAEDVLQSLCVRMLRRELPTDFGKNPKAYLYRAAVNLSLNTVRSKRRSIPADPVIDVEDPASRSRSRGEEEIFETLRRALTELPEKAAEILVLRYVHGYADSEIAKLLGTSRGTIAVSLFRTRARLRKSLRTSLGEKS